MLQVMLPNISGGICCRSCYQTSQVGYVAGHVTKHLRWDMLQVVLPKHLRRDMFQVYSFEADLVTIIVCTAAILVGYE